MTQRAAALPKSTSEVHQTEPPGAVDRELPNAQPRTRRDPVDIIWNLLCSLRFAVVLNVSVAAAAMIGTVIIQIPPGIENYDVEFQRFLSSTRSTYGPFADVLYWAGFFDLYKSLWFRMLVVVVVFSIIACTLNRWQPVMRQISKPTVRVSESFLGGQSEMAQFRAVPIPAPVAQEALTRVLRRGRYRVLSEPAPGGNGVHIYADRDRWSKLVTFGSHGALALLIITAAGLANFGWREQSVKFYPGKAVNVGHGTDFDVRNDGFSIEYYDDAVTVKEYKNTLAVLEAGREVLTKTITVNGPLTYEGTTFFLVSYQPVVYARATDASGTGLPLIKVGASSPVSDSVKSGGSFFAFPFTSTDNQAMDVLQVAARDTTLTLEMSYYQDVRRDTGENPPLYVRGFVDKEFDRPIYDAFIPRSGPFRLPGYEDYSFTFTSDTATVLEASQSPGIGLAGIFFALMALGFTISLYTTFVRCWVRITSSADAPGVCDVIIAGLADRNKVSFEREFEKLAASAYDALAARSAGVPSSKDAT